MANLHKIFVYGTLKTGEPNHHWFSKIQNGVANFVTEAKTSEKYPLVIATKYNMPFLLYSPGTGNNIRGELYEVDDATFEKLDELEDYPKFYTREQKTVISLCGNTEYENCWMYFLKNYKPELLKKPMLQSYSNKGLNGLSYMKHYDTNSNSHLDEVMVNLHKIFVYGTLKKGEPNHHWFSKIQNGVANFVTEAQTSEKYPLVIATKYNIPFLLSSPGIGNNIRGELYEVDDATFEKLDELEDYPKFYTREQKTVLSLRGNTEYQDCWIYFLKNYKPELLKKPMLQSYSNKGLNGLSYMKHYHTDSNSHLSEVMTSLHKVFVYGTLKKGEPNHHWFSKIRDGVVNFVGEAQTTEKYPLIIATKYNIPFLLYSPGTGNNIRGELYEVDDATFEKLDELEDYPNFYIREQKTVISLAGNVEHKNCWIYFLKNYKPELLQKPMLTSYSDKGPHGLRYLERYLRNTDYNHLDEVMTKQQ